MSKLPERHFKTHADLKNIIGQDLINDDDIAIVELVKNGIDAGAGKVTIEFSEDKSAIFIEDNGSGMSEFDIDNKWLNIAYSEKNIVFILAGCWPEIKELGDSHATGLAASLICSHEPTTESFFTS